VHVSKHTMFSLTVATGYVILLLSLKHFKLHFTSLMLAAHVGYGWGKHKHEATFC